MKDKIFDLGFSIDFSKLYQVNTYRYRAYKMLQKNTHTLRFRRQIMGSKFMVIGSARTKQLSSKGWHRRIRRTDKRGDV